MRPGSAGVPTRIAALERVDTMNLTQWREGRKDAVIALLFRFLPRHSGFYPVIPAKAGIQTVGNDVYAPLDSELRHPRALISARSLVNRLRPFQPLQLARRASQQAAYYRAVVFA